MLNDTEYESMIKELVATAELLGQEMTPTAAVLMADDLASYPVGVLASALRRVRIEHTGRLSPKVIIDRIEEALGRPAANEAWAIASKALDERETIVWTEEMSQAWFVARPIAAAGDMIGARMSFISTYERLVREARDARRLPVAVVSLGSDGAARAPALEHAVKLGYLTAEKARQYDDALPAPAITWVNPVALLSGNVEPTRGADAATRRRLQELRDEIARSSERKRKEREAAAMAQREAERQRKAEIRAAVDARLAEDGGA